MNILFICSAKAWGGNEKWSSMAIAGLKENNNVIFLGKNPQLHSKFNGKDISYTAPFSWNFDIKTRDTIAKICKEHSIDVIISTKKKEYFLAGLIARTFNIKHIIRLGIVRKMKIPLWSKLVYKQLNDGIIVNTERIKSELLKYDYFKKHPIKVIYNGMPKTDIISEPKPGKDSFKIVSTGMLTNRKGFHILIEALSMLSLEVRKKITLHIVGTGREEDKLKSMVEKLSLSDTVIFEGFTNKPMHFLKNANLFALISGNEGISNAIIEAMYSGIPVLTTTAGGAAEIIKDGETGFLTTRSPQDVADSLKKLISLDAEQLKTIGKTGKEKAVQMFNLAKMNKEIQDFVSE